VARIFGKAHSIVLGAIRNPIIPNDFHVTNFRYVELIEENALGGKVDRGYFKMTRNCFNPLMMGNTEGVTISGAYTPKDWEMISPPPASQRVGKRKNLLSLSGNGLNHQGGSGHYS
jgi:hypothetical protein